MSEAIENPAVPPAIKILLEEDLPSEPKQLKKRFSKSSLIRDLHTQALWTVQNFKYFQAQAHQLALAPSASLDPISRVRPCAHPQCLGESIVDLARTLGVYADVIVLPDNVTPLVGMTGNNELSDEESYNLFTMTLALKVLRPLIDAGVVRFVFGEQMMCQKHMTMFDRSVERVAKRTAREVLPDVQITLTSNGFTLTDEELFSPLQGYTFLSNDEEAYARLRSKAELKRRAAAGLSEQLRLIVRETALEMYSANDAGATYVLDSPLIAGTLSKAGGILLPQVPSGAEQLDTKLPWISDLSIMEVLELRDTAPAALARLRALLRSAREIGTPAAATEAKIREEAAEIEGELAALPVARNRQFRNTAGGLGLALSLVATAFGAFPTAAIGAGGTLLSLLALLQDRESKERHEVARLRSKPGYVLLRAKELIERRKHA